MAFHTRPPGWERKNPGDYRKYVPGYRACVFRQADGRWAWVLQKLLSHGRLGGGSSSVVDFERMLQAMGSAEERLALL